MIRGGLWPRSTSGRSLGFSCQILGAGCRRWSALLLVLAPAGYNTVPRGYRRPNDYNTGHGGLGRCRYGYSRPGNVGPIGRVSPVYGWWSQIGRAPRGDGVLGMSGRLNRIVPLVVGYGPLVVRKLAAALGARPFDFCSALWAFGARDVDTTVGAPVQGRHLLAALSARRPGTGCRAPHRSHRGYWPSSPLAAASRLSRRCFRRPGTTIRPRPRKESRLSGPARNRRGRPR